MVLFLRKRNPRKMAKSLCQLLIYVNHVLVANLNVASMPFNAIRGNKILVKISGSTVRTKISILQHNIYIITVNILIYKLPVT